MTLLARYSEHAGEPAEVLSDFDAIAARLGELGVQLERWPVRGKLSPGADAEEVQAAYAAEIETLNRHHGFQSVDVVSIRPDHPQAAEFRGKFLAEHTHADFEIRFFVDGRGLFYLHLGDAVYAVLCEAGDLISVPAHTPHWFDMGAAPDFKCIRFFRVPEGWVGDFTGSGIDRRFPDFDRFVAPRA